MTEFLTHLEIDLKINELYIEETVKNNNILCCPRKALKLLYHFRMIRFVAILLISTVVVADAQNPDVKTWMFQRRDEPYVSVGGVKNNILSKNHNFGFKKINRFFRKY